MKKHHNWGGFVSIFAATVFLSFFVIMAMYSFSIHDDTSGVAFLMTAGIFLLIFLIFTEKKAAKPMPPRKESWG